jgi:hypothetical protein
MTSRRSIGVGGWPQDQRSFGPLAAAGFEDPEGRDGEGHGGGLAALADQVKDAVPTQSLGVVLGPDGGSLVHGQGLGDLEEAG